MRVIAGTAKGVRLGTPPDRTIRPTLDRVREAVFSIIGPTIEGAHFLDLFSGTGAMGIEALSRGAARAVFVDRSRDAAQLIRDNIERARVSVDARVVTTTLPQGLSTLALDDPFDCVYADPPHTFDDHASVLATLSAPGCVAQDALVIIEHATRGEIVDAAGAFERVRQARYGKTTLSFFRRAS